MAFISDWQTTALVIVSSMNHIRQKRVAINVLPAPLVAEAITEWHLRCNTLISIRRD